MALKLGCQIQNKLYHFISPQNHGIQSAMESEAFKIPNIDLSGIVLENNDGWDAVQGEVMRALETCGCFEARYDRVTPELREALFASAMPELFSLPIDIKKLNKYSDLPYQGYLGKMPWFAYESLRVDDNDAEGFTLLMWPQGNPAFCETISTYLNQLKDLEQMIERMIFRSLGIGDRYESHIESTAYGVRLAEYGIPLDQETKIANLAHVDPNLITILCQHLVGGLEIQDKDGQWIQVVPSSNSFTVMIGEAFEALSNGRLQPLRHRVRILSNKKRYSALFGSRPKNDYIIQAPKELVDDAHPLLYKPYTFKDYLLYRFSGGGSRANDTLKNFCGVRREEMQA